MAFHCSPTTIPRFLDAFRSTDLRYISACACLNGKGKKKTQHTSQLMNGWRCVLVFVKGKFAPPRMLDDVLGPEVTENRWKHPQGWGQPLGEVRQLIRQLSAPGALVVDPMCGVTSPVATALEAQGRRYIGCDTDQRCVKLATKYVTEAIGSAGAKKAM